MKHPMQPICLDESVGNESGVIRFQSNKIIRYLCDTGKIDLNALALIPFDDDDRMQLAQLLGYSISGFSDLDYASDEVVDEADRLAETISQSEGTSEETKSYPATQIVHCPNGPIAACDEHAAQLKVLFEFMGGHVVSTTLTGPEECVNCINEAGD